MVFSSAVVAVVAAATSLRARVKYLVAVQRPVSDAHDSSRFNCVAHDQTPKRPATHQFLDRSTNSRDPSQAIPTTMAEKDRRPLELAGAAVLGLS